MLILTRKINETIIIAECIQVKILGIVDQRIKIGINAPINISIVREEIYFRDKMKNTHLYLPHPDDGYQNQISVSGT